MDIKQLHDKLQNDFWNYSAEYANHNGYRKIKQVTPEMRKKLAILKNWKYYEISRSKN